MLITPKQFLTDPEIINIVLCTNFLHTKAINWNYQHKHSNIFCLYFISWHSFCIRTQFVLGSDVRMDVNKNIVPPILLQGGGGVWLNTNCTQSTLYAIQKCQNFVIFQLFFINILKVVVALPVKAVTEKWLKNCAIKPFFLRSSFSYFSKKKTGNAVQVLDV